MTLASLAASAEWRDTAPLALQPAREARVLDLAHIRRTTVTASTIRRVCRASVVAARALALAAGVRSWWNRSVRKAAADALRLPAVDGVPPRLAHLCTSPHHTRLPYGGLVVSLGGGDQ